MKSTMNDPTKLKEINQNITDMEVFRLRKGSFNSQMMKTAYEYLGQPLLDNPISDKVSVSVFHTSVGRAGIMAISSIIRSITSTMEYAAGQQIHTLLMFSLSISGVTTQGIIITTSVVIIFLAVLSIFKSILDKYIYDQTDGDPSILKDTKEDVIYKSLKRNALYDPKTHVYSQTIPSAIV